MHDHYDIFMKKREYKNELYLQMTIQHEELDCITLLLTHAEAIKVAREMVSVINDLGKDIFPPQEEIQ
jgi:hypothetical protein